MCNHSKQRFTSHWENMAAVSRTLKTNEDAISLKLTKLFRVYMCRGVQSPGPEPARGPSLYNGLRSTATLPSSKGSLHPHWATSTVSKAALRRFGNGVPFSVHNRCWILQQLRYQITADGHNIWPRCCVFQPLTWHQSLRVFQREVEEFHDT